MKTKTLTDNVYEALKEDIIKLRLKPGEKLSEVILAERFNVSRAPIRNALAKLEQDKWVVIKPQIGTIVSLLSEKKAMDILQVRLLLEPVAAEIAARRINEGDLEILHQAFRNLENTSAANEQFNKIYFSTDSVLHEMIWKWCGNDEIYVILENYRSEIQRIQISNSELADRMAATAHEIWDIYRAISKRDSEKAKQTMYEHVFNIRKTISVVLDLEKDHKWI